MRLNILRSRYKPVDTAELADKGMTKLMLYTKESIVRALADDASPAAPATADMSTQGGA